MNLRRTLSLFFSLAVLTGMTGCTANANANAKAAKSETSSLQVGEQAPAVLLRKSGHPNIPATVRLNQLQRSNTWYNVDMADGQNGYRWGYINGHFQMQVTKDGGDSFASLTLPHNWQQALLSQGNGQLENPNVQVVDANRVYIFAVVRQHLIVQRTGDSGRHWTTERMPLSAQGLRFASVSMLGDEDAYVLLRGKGKTSATHELLHLRQHTGIVCALHVVGGAKDAGLPASSQAVVRFTNPREGWVIAASADGRLHLYMTSDAGKNWRSRTLNAPSALAGWKVVHVYQPVIAKQEGTFVVRYVGSTKGHTQVKTAVFRTRDKGAHFTGQAVEQLDHAAAGYMGDPVHFVNPDDGWSISDGRLIRTTGAGSVWKTIYAPALKVALPAYPRVLTVDYVSEANGFILLQSRDYRKNILLRTTDAGDSWKAIQPHEAAST